MSFLFNDPEGVAAAAADLAGIGSTINSANSVAAFPTTSIVPAGQDAVSAAVADLFGAHGQAYANFSSQLADFHSQLVTNLRDNANSYADAETANASSLQSAGQEALSAAATPAQAAQGAFSGNGAPAAAAGDQGVSVSANAPVFDGESAGSVLGTGASGGAAGAGISSGLGSRGSGENGGNGGRAGYRGPA
jgi:hypothetical protein